PAYAAALSTVETTNQIAGVVERLGDEFDVDFLAHQLPVALSESRDGLARVAKIVRAMKAFGHPESEGKRQADVNEAIATTLLVADIEFNDVADVVTHFGDLPPVPCHVEDINQVVLNLLVNAGHAI